MLGIKTKLSTAFHPQTDRQMEHINQELEQYLRFFIEHRQKDWPEWMASAEFAVNNKTHTATKVLLFMANYSRELRMGGYKEKGEGRKCDRICGEDEESTQGGRGGTKKDTEGDEEICRS